MTVPPMALSIQNIVRGVYKLSWHHRAWLGERKTVFYKYTPRKDSPGRHTQDYSGAGGSGGGGARVWLRCRFARPFIHSTVYTTTVNNRSF